MAVSTGQYSAFLPDPSSSFHSLKGDLKNISVEVKTGCSLFPVTFIIHLPSHPTSEGLHINLKKQSGSRCDKSRLCPAVPVLPLFLELFYCQDTSFFSYTLLEC